jgi:hypothetical protein
MNDLLPMAQSLAPGLRIVAPEAARGVYRRIELIARTWFGGTLRSPEPSSFGDSLYQIERLLADMADRWPDDGPPWILGKDRARCSGSPSRSSRRSAWPGSSP